MDFPNAIEHEKKLLGAMMLKKGECIPVIAEQLKADDFYRPEHRIIFNAILSAYEKNKPLEAVFVADELKRTDAFKHIDTKLFFAILQGGVTDAYVDEHIAAIKEAAAKRQVLAFADTLQRKAQSPAVTVEELMADVESFLVKPDNVDQSSFETTTQIATDVYQRTTKLSKTIDLTGVSTGLWDLNNLTNGLQRGELILLAARPAMGKTALALNIAQGAANAKKVVVVFSLEMSKRQIGIRVLSALSNVEATKIATGQNLGERDYEYMLGAIEDMERHPFYIDDTGSLTVAAMRMKLRRFKQEHGLDFVVVDYLQLMRGNGENRVQEISEISRGLKALAKEFDVPILALSQLSRNVEMRAEKKPQLSDLRDSGSLEQDADIVMFLYRDEYYNHDDEENKNLAELIVAKNRNGATATLELFFRKETMYFGDFVRYLPPEQEDIK